MHHYSDSWLPREPGDTEFGIAKGIFVQRVCDVEQSFYQFMRDECREVPTELAKYFSLKLRFDETRECILEVLFSCKHDEGSRETQRGIETTALHRDTQVRPSIIRKAFAMTPRQDTEILISHLVHALWKQREYLLYSENRGGEIGAHQETLIETMQSIIDLSPAEPARTSDDSD